jgi:hypothetical protein
MGPHSHRAEKIMRYSEIKRRQLEIEDRLAKALAELASDSQETKMPDTPVSEFPKPQELPPTSAETNEGDEIPYTSFPFHECPKIRVRRMYPGGKSKICPTWLEPLCKEMADGTTLKKAASRLGLRFTLKDERRIRHLTEFKRMLAVYRRLFNSNVWGQPNFEEAKQQLMSRVDCRRHQRSTKPREAKYISHLPKKKPS